MNKKQITSKKYILIALSILLVVATVAYVYKRSNSTSTSYPDTEKAVNTVDYGPPTEEEENAGDKQKMGTTSPKTTTGTQHNGKKSLSVIITDASQYDNDIEVRAFIQNYIKSGTCTIILQNGETQIKKQVPAYADASSTICTNLTLNRNEISAGTWNVSVSFESDDATGISEVKVMKVN